MTDIKRVERIAAAITNYQPIEMKTSDGSVVVGLSTTAPDGRVCAANIPAHDDDSDSDVEFAITAACMAIERKLVQWDHESRGEPYPPPVPYPCPKWGTLQNQWKVAR